MHFSISARRPMGIFSVLEVLSVQSYEVLLVEDASGRRFIGKRLPWALSANKVKRAEFLAELHHLQSFDHPHLVRAHEVFADHADGPFAMMPCALMNLEVRLGLGITLHEGLSHLTDTAAALDFLHGQSLCHYDVKPENILIFERTPDLTFEGPERPGHYARLNDFSLIRSTLHEPDNYGDRLYSAPEIFEERNVPDELRIRSDVLSLAVTASTVLCGLPVPLADREIENAEYWLPLPQTTRGVLRMACARDMSARPASASSLISLLVASLQHIPPESLLPIKV